MALSLTHCILPVSNRDKAGGSMPIRSGHLGQRQSLAFPWPGKGTQLHYRNELRPLSAALA